MNKLFFIISFLLTFIFTSQAQNVLKGNIHDDSGIGIPSTTIRILTKDSTFINGGVTDDNGCFLFNDIKAGEYILAISNIGYVSQLIDFRMQNKEYILPSIILKTDNILLNEVEIKVTTQPPCLTTIVGHSDKCEKNILSVFLRCLCNRM